MQKGSSNTLICRRDQLNINFVYYRHRVIPDYTIATIIIIIFLSATCVIYVVIYIYILSTLYFILYLYTQHSTLFSLRNHPRLLLLCLWCDAKWAKIIQPEKSELSPSTHTHTTFHLPYISIYKSKFVSPYHIHPSVCWCFAPFNLKRCIAGHIKHHVKGTHIHPTSLPSSLISL